MPAPKLSAWFSGFCFCFRPKNGWMQQPWQDFAKEESQLSWEPEWKERENQKKWLKGEQDARRDGFRTAQQQKPYCPLVYTQPHPSAQVRPGPFLFSEHPSTHQRLPFIALLLISLKPMNMHYLWKWEKKKQAALYSSWINCVNNEQLGANLQTLSSISTWWMQHVKLDPRHPVIERWLTLGV